MSEEKVQSEVSCDDNVPEMVFRGMCPLQDLPPLNKKVVRIFFSSTFTDTKEERNALMQNVYPKLAELCREKHGLEFQVVDMRWGVPEQAADNHSTTEVCLQEIKKCQEVSVGPNFVALIGQKYGYRPMPTIISSAHFEALQESAKGDEKIAWGTVSQWYLKDDNANPPVYMLQAVSSIIKNYASADAKLKKEANNQWNAVSELLTSTLRKCAQKAKTTGKLSEDDAHSYFMSVTENEVKHGVLNSKTNPKESAIIMLRKIPDITQHLTESKAPKFVDLKSGTTTPDTSPEFDEEAQQLLSKLREDKLEKAVEESNLTKYEIEWAVSGANISLESVDSSVAKFPEKEIKVDSNILKHKNYLDTICSEFFEKVSDMINQGENRQSKIYDELTIEVLQHLHLAKSRCEVFEGRAEVLEEIQTYLQNDSNLPLVIYGSSGCGKTSILAKVIEKLETWVTQGPDIKPVCVARFMGTSPLTSNLHQVLTTTCLQLSKVFGTPWEEPERFSDLVNAFQKFLSQATKDKPIYIVFDSLDQLQPAYQAYKLDWMPDELPPFVKMVVSTITEDYPILGNMQQKYEASDMKFIEVQPLGQTVGLEIIKKWLEKIDRKMSAQQTEIVLKALEACSLPLYARIIFEHTRRWRSYETVDQSQLENTIKGAISKLLENIEVKFGAPLVQHCLAYFTASRNGISEVELEHILSLDDDLLNKIYKFWKPPIRRVPPLLWTRIRAEINNYIVERSADDITVLFWYHRQFITSAKERYLKDPKFALSVHENMADFFQGKWGGGKEKPFQYSESQKKRFGLDDLNSAADRKIPKQPYIFQSKNSSQEKERFNKRKLSELPFHLLKCKQYEELYKNVFFSYEWLYSKIRSSSVQETIEEYSIFMLADKRLRANEDLKLLSATLQMIRPYVYKYPNSLALELSGRLAKYTGKSSNLTYLVKQCDTFGPNHCAITPMFTCFEPAHIGLQQNINFRSSEPWNEGGCMTCTQDFKTMYIIDADDRGIQMLYTWDLESGEKVNESPIDKRVDPEQNTMDMNFQMRLDHIEKHLFVLYRQKFFGGFHKERFRPYGMMDIVDVSNGKVLKTIEGFLHDAYFSNPFLYVTKNWISLRFGAKMPLIETFGEKKIDLGRPHLLTENEEFFLVTKCKKPAKLRVFESKEDIFEFDSSNSVDAVAITPDTESMLMAERDDETGNKVSIRVYNTARMIQERSFKFVKVARTLTLPRQETIKSWKGNNEESEDKKVCAVANMKISGDNQYVIGIFAGHRAWEAFLWNMVTSKYIKRLTEKEILHTKHPCFTNDSKFVILCKVETVRVIACKDGSVLQEYNMNKAIRDFFVPATGDQFCVLLAKDVVILDVGRNPQNKKEAKRKAKQDQTTKVEAVTESWKLLDSETRDSASKWPEIWMTDDGEAMTAWEEGQEHKKEEMRMLLSASGARRTALQVWHTPDCSKVIQLHSRPQVVDLKEEEIKYSLRAGDFITRSTTNPETGQMGNENLQIPHLDPLKSVSIPLDLTTGDRIMQDGNKTKYRIGSASSRGKVQIMKIPSLLVVKEVAKQKNEKPRKVCEFKVYQEEVMSVSNSYIVTRGKRNIGDFANLYELETGKFIVTQSLVGTQSSGACLSKDERQLFIVDANLCLKQYGGNSFLTCMSTIDVPIPSSDVQYLTRSVSLFMNNPDAILIKYSPPGTEGFNLFYNVHVNLVTKEVSKPIENRFPFEDISQDGNYAVDSTLSLYNLPKGDIIRQLPYKNNNSDMQVQVRFSTDMRYVLFVDRQDDTLHVHSFEDGRILAECFIHMQDVLAFDLFSLRSYGRILVVRGKMGLSLLVLRDSNDASVVSKEEPLGYMSEKTRCLSLLPKLGQEVFQEKTPSKAVIESKREDESKIQVSKPPEIQSDTKKVISTSDNKDRITNSQDTKNKKGLEDSIKPLPSINSRGSTPIPAIASTKPPGSRSGTPIPPITGTLPGSRSGTPIPPITGTLPGSRSGTPIPSIAATPGTSKPQFRTTTPIPPIGSKTDLSKSGTPIPPIATSTTRPTATQSRSATPVQQNNGNINQAVAPPGSNAPLPPIMPIESEKNEKKET